jgi:hypothetical protein
MYNYWRKGEFLDSIIVSVHVKKLLLIKIFFVSTKNIVDFFIKSKPTIMKKFLLLLVMSSVITVAFSQKRKKSSEQPLTGYAITSIEKGGRSWKEVRLVNITTGEELRSVYNSKTEVEAFNARTGSPIIKKDGNATVVAEKKKVVNLDQELAAANGNTVRVRTVIINIRVMINHLLRILRRWLMIKNMKDFIIRQWELTSFATSILNQVKFTISKMKHLVR